MFERKQMLLFANVEHLIRNCTFCHRHFCCKMCIIPNTNRVVVQKKRKTFYSLKYFYMDSGLLVFCMFDKLRTPKGFVI